MFASVCISICIRKKKSFFFCFSFECSFLFENCYCCKSNIYKRFSNIRDYQNIHIILLKYLQYFTWKQDKNSLQSIILMFVHFQISAMICDILLKEYLKCVLGWVDQRYKICNSAKNNGSRLFRLFSFRKLYNVSRFSHKAMSMVKIAP